MAVRRTVHWTSLRLDWALLASFFERSCSLSKFQGRPHLPIIALLYRDRARALPERFLLLMWTCCGCVLDHRCLDAGVSIRLLDCSYFSIISIQGYSQAWPHAPSYSFYKWYMRILRVVYGIYTTCTDQSDFSICYNYDLNTHNNIIILWHTNQVQYLPL